MQDFFISLNKIYIVGAGSRAKTLTGYLSYLYPAVCVSAYLVDTLEGNDANINGVPVKELGENVWLDVDVPVLIATKGIYHEEICRKLTGIGFTQICPVTSQVDNFLRNAYVKAVFEAEGREFCKIEELPCAMDESGGELAACIYMAKSIYDKPLQSEYQKPVYEEAIQVGSKLTEQRLADCTFRDDVGDNISHKNRQYCELTAMYWIWKHATEPLVGLSHYRRHFILPKDWQVRMNQNGVDVILPVPTFVQPSIVRNYRERHDAGDLDVMLSFLEQRDAKDYCMAKEVFAGNLYYPCNMFIMKKEILNELCEWLFPILDYVVEKCGTKEDVYLNRYPGFLAERLVTVFFTRYKEKYKIVLADKSFIS